MNGVRVERIEQADESSIHDWWATGRAAEEERSIDLWPAWETARPHYTSEQTDREMVFLAAYDADRMVGACRLDLPHEDNVHLVLMMLLVHPERRRHGVGSALVAAAEAFCADRGRTTLLTTVHAPVDRPEPLAMAFADRHGYALAGCDATKVADLLGTEASWPALEARAAERAGGYRLQHWTDPAPEEWLEQVCVLYSRFLGEIPLGEVDMEPQTWTPERYRQGEERRTKEGQRHLMVTAVAPDGTLAGYSDLVIADAMPHLAEVDGTLVLPEHRGHRLGLALKVLLHREARGRFPRCRAVVTGNASVNPWMSAVNGQLGYRVVERGFDVQKRLR